MGAVMWIEVLSRHGEVAARERIDGPEARVGRAFDNDVVVDDPHVAPHHLRIFRGEDGELVAEDLGTLNGLYPEHGARRVERVGLAGAPGIRIGRTTLRVHDAAHAVLLWSGLWALLSRLFFGQARFALQVRIALTACIALIVWDQLSETLSFGLAWRALSEYASLGAWALLAATCYAHLLAIGPRRMRIAMGVIVALAGAGAAIQSAGKWEARHLVGEPATLGDLRPPAFRLRPLARADAFFQRTPATRASVDRARMREPASGLFSEPEAAD
jgi:hypothetical protein